MGGLIASSGTVCLPLEPQILSPVGTAQVVRAMVDFGNEREIRADRFRQVEEALGKLNTRSTMTSSVAEAA